MAASTPTTASALSQNAAEQHLLRLLLVPPPKRRVEEGAAEVYMEGEELAKPTSDCERVAAQLASSGLSRLKAETGGLLPAGRVVAACAAFAGAGVRSDGEAPTAAP